MKLLTSFFSVIIFSSLFGQYQLNLHGTSLKPDKTQFSFESAIKVQQTTRKHLAQLIADGYAQASIDSLIIADSGRTTDAYFHKGPVYKIANITFHSSIKLPGNYLNKKNRIFNSSNYNYFIEKQLTFLENNGYPFGHLELDSLKIKNDQVGLVLNLETGPIILIDSIIVKGGISLPGALMTKILGIKQGELYNQQKINLLNDKIKKTPFLKLIKPTEYEFLDNSCLIHSYIDPNTAGQINGILGLVNDQKGNAILNGELKAKTINLLKHAETISFNWKKIKALTQELRSSAIYPYLFNSPFGVSGQFNLSKWDSTFIDIQGRIGAMMQFDFYNNITVFGEKRSMNLLSTPPVTNNRSDFLDVEQKSYGIELQLNSTDNRLNPTQGFMGSLLLSAGKKNIRKNPLLDEEIYKDLILSSSQYQIECSLFNHQKLTSRQVLKFGFQTGWLENPNLFKNELFRLGGMQSIRGFSELSLLAQKYFIGTLEWRFLLEQNSNVFLFSDWMYYETGKDENKTYDKPFSLGLGSNFETQPGIFTVGYALGVQQNNPIQFKNAIVYFGFSNKF